MSLGDLKMEDLFIILFHVVKMEFLFGNLISNLNILVMINLKLIQIAFLMKKFF